MTTAELEALIRSLQEYRTDLVHVEAKRAESDLPKRLWETVSAFSNTPGGGVLILGLDEAAGFAAAGVQDPKKLMQDLGTLCGEMLRTLRALVPYRDGWVPSLGGLLALGSYPQQFFPELGVTFVAYPTPRYPQGSEEERLLDAMLLAVLR